LGRDKPEKPFIERPAISPERALGVLISEDPNWRFIDVRSPSEVEKARLPHFVNLPILEDPERRVVGTIYKNEGQERAIEEGLSLVLPHKAERVQGWLVEAEEKKRVLFMCWRGGLRSKIAASWCGEARADVYRLEGGYKAIRHRLLKVFENMPSLIVITGLTGCGKTRLLHEIPNKKIDLEGLANHRGSTFGYYIDRTQPSQAAFENALAMEVLRKGSNFLVEDESLLIGRIALPQTFKERMRGAPIVVLRANMEERVRWIFEEYIKVPLEQGQNAQALFQHLNERLLRLKKKLGGERCQRLSVRLEECFSSDPLRYELHSRWIEPLLAEYYDKMYSFALKRQSRKVLFEGNYQECKEWFENKHEEES
jgi:tRNA 2-selenouridine synthase